jgi:sialidase-1
MGFFVICIHNLYAQRVGFSDTTLLLEPDRDGYTMFHVPALVISKKGTILAFAEGRFGNGNDWADIDLVMRRSLDKGKTWEPLKIIIPHTNGKPTSNITPIADENGTIHLLFQINYAKAYYMKSLDEGENWSKPQEITYVFDLFKNEYDWKVLAPGPGHAIQLNNGWLLVPVWLCIPDRSKPGGDHRPSCVATIYSDDHGTTWKRGDIISNNGDMPAGSNDTIVNPNESVVLQLSDGRVMINMRNESKVNRRLVSYSPDGISHWSIPVFDTELFEPVCMASLIRITEKNQDRNRILFVNPDSRNNPIPVRKYTKVNKPRENLTAKLSYDEGKTWPVQKVLNEKGAGYSDLAVDEDGVVYCLYEIRNGGNSDWKYRIVIRRFNLQWLTNDKDFITHN